MWKLLRIPHVVLLICTLCSGAAFSDDDLTKFLPESVDGWTKSGIQQSYNRQNLFDYIDGGAEIYLAYDFRQLRVQHCTDTSPDSAEKGSITAEVWRMDSSADAYGLFSLERDGEKIDVGQDGVYGYDRVRFWKGRFFVDVFSENEGARDILIKIGKKIASKIKESGDRPPLVSKLPRDNLISGSVHFFHQYLVLKNLYFFERAESLGLDSETDCVLADYAMDEDTLKFLVIEYPDTVKATSAHIGFIMIEPPGTASQPPDRMLRGPSIVAGSEGTFGIIQQGRYLALAFDGQDKYIVKLLLSRFRI
jgi:hypothetical protein